MHTDEGRCAGAISSEPTPATARRAHTPQQITPGQMQKADCEKCCSFSCNRFGYMIYLAKQMQCNVIGYSQ